MPEVRALPSSGVTRSRRYYDPVRLPPDPPPEATLKLQTPTGRVSPDYPHRPPDVPCPIPRWIGRVRASIASPPARPSPNSGRVGIHDFPFEACSGFTRVTARWIAQPPEAAFVTRLRPGQSPNRTARQLPGQSTTPWVEPTSTGYARLRGAPEFVESRKGAVALRLSPTAPFPFPAHQTGRADFPHPAFRPASLQVHGGGPRPMRLRRSTPSSP
jgi:hypothetical protein